MLEPDKNSSPDRESDNYNSGDNNSDVDLLKLSTEEDKLPSLKQSTKIYKPTQLQQNNPKKEISTTTSSEKNKLNFSTSNRGNLRDATGYTSAPTSSKANTSILPRNAKIANPQAATAATPARSISAKREPSRLPNVATAASRPISAKRPSRPTIETGGPPGARAISEAPTSPRKDSDELQDEKELTTAEENLILEALPEEKKVKNIGVVDFKIKIKNFFDKHPDEEYKFIKDYILIQATKTEGTILTDKINNIIGKKKKYIETQFNNLTKLSNLNFNNLQTSIKNFLNNPGTSSQDLIKSMMNSIKKDLLKSEPSAASFSASQQIPVSFKSNCEILGKTLMPELIGDMRPALSDAVPKMCNFFLSNKRYCYHIMRSDGNYYLKELISYFYINKSLRETPPKIPRQIPLNGFNNLSNFPYINDIFTTPEQIDSVENLVIPPNSKKNVLFVLNTTKELNKIPRILIQQDKYYVLVSFMITSASTDKTIESVSIPEKDPSENVPVTVVIGSKIMLNYQKMLFPPDITTGETFKKIQSKPQDLKYINGGKKTIRKYRKHNRNKTTRNYN